MAAGIHHTPEDYSNDQGHHYYRVSGYGLPNQFFIPDTNFQGQYMPWDQDLDAGKRLQKTHHNMTTEVYQAPAPQFPDTGHLRPLLFPAEDHTSALPLPELAHHEIDTNPSCSDRPGIAVSSSPCSTDISSNSIRSAQPLSEHGGGIQMTTAASNELFCPASMPSNAASGFPPTHFHTLDDTAPMSLPHSRPEGKLLYWTTDQPMFSQMVSLPTTSHSFLPNNASIPKSSPGNAYKAFPEIVMDASSQAQEDMSCLNEQSGLHDSNRNDPGSTVSSQYQAWLDCAGSILAGQPNTFTPANVPQWPIWTPSSRMHTNPQSYVEPSAASLGGASTCASDAEGRETSSELAGNSAMDCGDSSRDQYILHCRQLGWSYKRIKDEGHFYEAESTLRGRYRCLVKPKEARVRRPEWTPRDIELLHLAVRFYDRDRGAIDKTKRRHVRRAEAEGRLPWKKIAEYIQLHGGTYRFGNATCRKKWDEVGDDDECQQGAN